jgi:ferredoxin
LASTGAARHNQVTTAWLEGDVGDGAMKVRIDRERCSGHGRCYSLVSEVFDSDDDGYGIVISEDVAPELEARAEIGALNCPEQAISVTR